jgi:hypothetical protein
VSEIKLVFSIPPHRPTPDIAPSWNVAATDPLPVVRYDPKGCERRLDVMRWGLVPFWAKDIKVVRPRVPQPPASGCEAPCTTRWCGGDKVAAMSADNNGFELDADVDENVAKDIQAFNSILRRLRERRLTEIAISGPLRKSKLAWKIATYQQPMLYRVVMLASGCAANWNAPNLLCAYLAARALIETVAVFWAFEVELQQRLIPLRPGPQNVVAAEAGSMLEQMTNKTASGGPDDRLSTLLDRVPTALRR